MAGLLVRIRQIGLGTYLLRYWVLCTRIALRKICSDTLVLVFVMLIVLRALSVSSIFNVPLERQVALPDMVREDKLRRPARKLLLYSEIQLRRPEVLRLLEREEHILEILVEGFCGFKCVRTYRL